MTEEVVAPVLLQFRQTSASEGITMTAYCFMPDHVHFLLTAHTEASDLRRFVAAAKQRSGFLHARTTGKRLWQEGYYEHVRDEESALAVVRYILTNPIRAGLTRALGEYGFSGSDEFSPAAIEECSEMWERPRSRRRP